MDKKNISHSGPENMTVVYDQEDAENIYNTNSEIIQDVKKRLNKGAAEYGESIPKDDPRDFAHELYEELMDAVVYGLVLGKRLKSTLKLLNTKKDG